MVGQVLAVELQAPEATSPCVLFQQVARSKLLSRGGETRELACLRSGTLAPLTHKKLDGNVSLLDLCF